MITYPQQFTIPPEYVRKKLTEFYSEDITENDRTTTGTISTSAFSKAIIQSREDIVFVGNQILPVCFPEDCEVNVLVNDGEKITAGKNLVKISGPSIKILTRERVVLNLLQRLCGIASVVRQYVDLALPFNVKILDTRKTTPGLRLFEKHAVVIGGGYNHRLNLSDGILIKDNHIQAAGSITGAVERMKSNKDGLPIEVEVETTDQINEALNCNVDGLLLDNMPPDTIKKSVKQIRRHNYGKNVFIESSGNINLSNISSYLPTGVDGISIGALTHSVKNADLRLEFIS